MRRNYKNIDIICENLSLLYDSGIPLIESVRLLKETNLKKDYKNSIINIEASLLKGKSLSKSFSTYPKLYPSFFNTFINVGEMNGKLSKVLIRLKEYYGKRKKINDKLKTVLAYPIFLISILMLLSIAIVFLLIPIIYDMFSSTANTMNSSIEKIYEFRNGVIKNPLLYLLYFLCYFVIIPILLYLILKDKINIFNFLLKIKVVRLYYECILILVLSIIFDSGINVVKGINDCSKYCNEKLLKEELYRINKDLMKGIELSKSLYESKFISKSSISMINIGEKGGKINEVLLKLETILSDKFTKTIDKYVNKMQPIMLLISAIFVLVFIFKFILPVLELSYL